MMVHGDTTYLKMQRVEEIDVLVHGLPPEVMVRALVAALARLEGAPRESLTRVLPPACPTPNAETVMEAVRSLPADAVDRLATVMLDVAAQAALETGAFKLGAASDPESPPPVKPAAEPVRAPTPTRAPAPLPPPHAQAKPVSDRRSGTKGQPFVLEAGARFQLPASGEHAAREVAVQSRLAEGGGGIVYLGRDQAGAPIIVKTGKVSATPPLSLRVERAVLEPLDHPNLVRLLGSHEDASGNLLLFLELLFPNPVLHLNQSHVLERIEVRAKAPGARYLPPPPSLALELVHDLLRGIEALHAVGFVHNDVKLSNFFVAIDNPSPEIADRTYFQALATSAFHGVLIDAGGIRNQETLAELNRGEADPLLPPIELTPIYAPPEALVGRLGDPGERPYHSAATDVYAAALVAYTTITGYVPYSHLRTPVDARNLQAVLDLKRAERRGSVSPIAREHLREARFQDSRFLDPGQKGHELCRSVFERELVELLLRRVDPDPAKRGSVTEMKREFERRFSIRALSKTEFGSAKKIGDRGPRFYRQNHFVVSPYAPGSRLVQAAGKEPAAGDKSVARPTRRITRSHWASESWTGEAPTE